MTADTGFHVALGSNLGDRRAHLDFAVAALDALDGVRVLAVSRWHETAPVGGPPGQPAFLNGVLAGRTRLEPLELLGRLQQIERSRGRVRDPRERNGPRTLDLDLLLFGDRRRSGADLELPHPRLEERDFVLAPLAEIAPELILPRSGRTVAACLADLRAATLSPS